MFTRILSSAAVGVAVTTGLLFLMQYLIASGEEILTEPRIRHDLGLVRVKRKEVLATREIVPERIAKPKVPPKTDLQETVETGGVGFKIPGPPIPGTGPNIDVVGGNFSDGPLINVIKVLPQYPVRLASQGIEGTVLVQFDVTRVGTVENVVVVESSNRGFDKAAIKAAYRFRYKPRIVDGVPYGTQGIRNLFRFEMEK